MSNSGHKNITYRDNLNDYFVQIVRKGRALQLSFNSLEEAIEIRDRVLQFYEKFDRFPTRKELNLKRRERRIKIDKDHEKFISLDMTCGKRPYRIRIDKDCQIFTQNLTTLEEAIKRRDEVLKFYYEHDRLPNREEQENIFGVRFKTRSHSRSSKTQSSNTGYRNISFNTSLKRYNFAISRKGQIFSINVDTLEEAISIRKEILKFYDNNDRLPTKLEYRASLKKGTLL